MLNDPIPPAPPFYAYDGYVRAERILGFCPVCHRPVRERHSRSRKSMPGAGVGVHYHLRCDLTSQAPWERPPAR